MVATTETIQLTERDEQILRDHLGRFRITTNEALRQIYWSDRTPDAVKKWGQRMRAGQYLRTGNLGNGRQFFFPTHKTVLLAGLPRSYAKPPKGYDLARFYGVLSFCCLGPTKYQKIASTEFHQRFGQLCSPSLVQALYYADTDFQDERHPQHNRIGYLLVDAGGRLRQILKSFHDVISKRLRVPLWHQWIERDRFIITVVTADPDKARRLRDALAAIRQPVLYRVEIRLDIRDVIPLEVEHASQRQDNP